MEVQGRATLRDIEAACHRSARKAFAHLPLLVVTDEFTPQAVDHVRGYIDVAILLRDGEKWKSSEELLYGS